MYIKILRYISFILLLLFIFSCSGLGFFDRFIPDDKVRFSWANITPNKNTDHIALENAPLTLEATIAIQLSSLQYQWEIAIPGSTIFTDIVGATNSTYKIPRASGKNHNQHQYRCKIARSTDVSVIRYTGIITLAVISFVNQPINQNFNVGDTITFTSEVNYDKPNLIQYQWQSAMRGSDVFTDIQGATKHIYTIPNITNDYHKRQYRCVISINDSKLYSNTATLFSNAPPLIVNTIAGTGTNSFSGDGGLATSARLNNPQGVAIDNNGNIYIADTINHRIRKIETSGVITTIAGSGGRGVGNGAFGGDGGLATSATLNLPSGVAVDNNGNIYIADSGNHRIRKIDTSGVIATIAGTGTNSFSGDTGLATSASLNIPQGVAVDNDGNIYIADNNNHRIRKVDTSGIITTIIGDGTDAELNNPTSVAVDNSRNVYVADTYNQRIRKLNVSTNTLSNITFTSNTVGVAVADNGNIYITTTPNDIKKHNPNVMGVAATTNITMSSMFGSFSGDNGDLASSARFNFPNGIAVDAHGNIYIADSANNRIRKLSD